MLVNYKLADGKVIQVEVNEEVAKFLQEDDKAQARQQKQIKRNISSASLEVREESGEEIVDESPSPLESLITEEEELEQAIMEGRLKEAIVRLNPRQQEMVKMYYFESKSQQQIADRFGISFVAVYYAMNIILKKLKKILEK